MDASLLMPAVTGGSIGLVAGLTTTGAQRLVDYLIKRGTGSFPAGTHAVVTTALKARLATGEYGSCNNSDLPPNSILNDYNSQYSTYAGLKSPDGQDATFYLPRDLFRRGLQNNAMVLLILTTPNTAKAKGFTNLYNFPLSELGLPDRAGDDPSLSTRTDRVTDKVRQHLTLKRHQDGFDPAPSTGAADLSKASGRSGSSD